MKPKKRIKINKIINNKKIWIISKKIKISLKVPKTLMEVQNQDLYLKHYGAKLIYRLFFSYFN